MLNCVSLCTLYHYVYSDGKMWFCFICDTVMCANPYRLDGPHLLYVLIHFDACTLKCPCPHPLWLNDEPDLGIVMSGNPV